MAAIYTVIVTASMDMSRLPGVVVIKMNFSTIKTAVLLAVVKSVCSY